MRIRSREIKLLQQANVKKNRIKMWDLQTRMEQIRKLLYYRSRESLLGTNWWYDAKRDYANTKAEYQKVVSLLY